MKSFLNDLERDKVYNLHVSRDANKESPEPKPNMTKPIRLILNIFLKFPK